MRNYGPIKLVRKAYPSRSKFLKKFSFGMTIILLGVLMLLVAKGYIVGDAEDYDEGEDTLGILIMAAGVFYCLSILMPFLRRLTMIIDERGVKIRKGFTGIECTEWQDVRRIALEPGVGVLLYLKRGCDKAATQIPGFSNVSSQHMYDMINYHFERYRTNNQRKA